MLASGERGDMGRRKKRKSKPFVQIFNELLKSEAYKELSHASFRAYVHIKAKYNGSNGDNLSFTYKEASKIMNVHTFSKAIGQLVELGFIDIVRSGHLYNTCNIFALSDRWKQYGMENFVKGKRYVPDPKKW